MSQPLQWSGLVAVSTQRPPHACFPDGQLVAHEPLAQTRPAPQTTPQAPQLFGSLAVSMQSLPHFESPALQLKPHCPSVQVAEALAGSGQTVPQPPQLSGSVCVITH